jgi:hypothetical protein
MWAELIPLKVSRPGNATLAHVARLAQQLVPRYTMLSVPRMVCLFERVLDLQQRQILGAVVECGVWNGGASATMAAAMATGGGWRDMWLFDSFEGLPPPTAEDPAEVHAGYHAGWCLGHPEMARACIRAEGLPEERLHIVKGWFADTFPMVSPGTIALLHVDADWYAPVKLCLETFYDLVAPGGVIVLDDYGRWDGCRVATDEFLANRGLDVHLQRVDASGMYFIKP